MHPPTLLERLFICVARDADKLFATNICTSPPFGRDAIGDKNAAVSTDVRMPLRTSIHLQRRNTLQS